MKTLQRSSFTIRTILLILLFSVIITFFRTIQTLVTHHQSGKESTTLEYPIVPHAKRRTHLENTAFVFLGLGVQAHQRNCIAAIESLVKHAGWSGEVYLITDKAHCFDEEEIIRHSSIERNRLHLISIINESFDSGGITFHSLRNHVHDDRIRAKAMKTRVFEFIDKRIDTVAFVDCDVLFAIEGCATELFQIGNLESR